MSYFDNIDKQLEEIKRIKSLEKNLHNSFKRDRKRGRLNGGSRIKDHYKKQKADERFNLKQLRIIKKASKKGEKERLKIGVRNGKETRKYHLYIESAEWTKRKNDYYRKHKKQCSICYSPIQVNLHHAVYANFGREKNEHLYPLCREHHKQFHEIHGVKGNMLLETQQFILCEKEKYQN